MLRTIFGAAVLLTSTTALAENWMAGPINTNVEGKRAAPLIDRDGINRTDPAHPFVVHAVLYENPMETIAQRVWLSQFDCVLRTFRMVSEETRDNDGKLIQWRQINAGAVPIKSNTILEDFLLAACEGKWAPRLQAMGHLSNAELNKALFKKP